MTSSRLVHSVRCITVVSALNALGACGSTQQPASPQPEQKPEQKPELDPDAKPTSTGSAGMLAASSAVAGAKSMAAEEAGPAVVMGTSAPNDAQSAAQAASTCNGPLPVMKMLDKVSGGIASPDWSCLGASKTEAAAAGGMQALQFKLLSISPKDLEGVNVDFFLGDSTLEKPFATKTFDGVSNIVPVDVPSSQRALTVKINGLQREETARSIAELREYNVPILKPDEPVQGFMLLTSQRKLIVFEALKDQPVQDDDHAKGFLVSYARDCSGHDVSGAQFELVDAAGAVVKNADAEGQPHESYMQYAIPNPECTYTSIDQSAWVLINAPVNATEAGKSQAYRLRVKGRVTEADSEPVIFGEAEVEMVAGAITFVHLPVEKH